MAARLAWFLMVGAGCPRHKQHSTTASVFLFCFDFIRFVSFFVFSSVFFFYKCVRAEPPCGVPPQPYTVVVAVRRGGGVGVEGGRGGGSFGVPNRTRKSGL